MSGHLSSSVPALPPYMGRASGTTLHDAAKDILWKSHGMSERFEGASASERASMLRGYWGIGIDTRHGMLTVSLPDDSNDRFVVRLRNADVAHSQAGGIFETYEWSAYARPPGPGYGTFDSARRIIRLTSMHSRSRGGWSLTITDQIDSLSASITGLPTGLVPHIVELIDTCRMMGALAA